MIKLRKNKTSWIKLSWVIFTLLTYMAIGIATGGNVLWVLGSMLTIIAILNFAKRTTLSILLFTLVEMCNIGVLIELYGTTRALGTPNPELLILTVGLIGNIVYIVLKIRKDKAPMGSSIGAKIVNFITYETRPIKLRLVFRLIIYTLLIVTCITVSSEVTKLGVQGLTLISSIWAVIPTFYTLTTVLRLSQMYVMRMVAQAVYLVIVYMQFALGQSDYVSLISNLIILITLITGYIEYIRITSVDTKITSNSQ